MLWRRLVDEHGMDDAALEAVRAGVEEELDEAIAWAKEQGHPAPEDALGDVYVDSIGGAALR